MHLGIVILLILLYSWWLYSSRAVIQERHDWLQQELDIRSAQKATLLDILAQRSLILKFTDMKDEVSLNLINQRTTKRLEDPMFRQMLAVAEVAEDTEAPTEWRKKWTE
jgi:hypothetical protein